MTGGRGALLPGCLPPAVTQVFDQPHHGRAFFEQAIRDHLDLGRPDQIALLFERRVTKRTRGPFRTRVIHDGVKPNQCLSPEAEVSRAPAGLPGQSSRRAVGHELPPAGLGAGR